MGLKRLLGQLSYVSRDGSTRTFPLYRVRIKALRLINGFQKLVSNAIYHTPLKSVVLNRYANQMSPAQLYCLCSFLSDTAAVPGCIVEIGCADGRTTLFLYYFMIETRIYKEYFALDTFDGFTEKDVAWEVAERNKRKGMYIAFKNNSHQRFRSMLSLNGADAIKTIKADVNLFDLQSLTPVSLALVDVDLYLPTRKAIAELYASLSPGGVLIVDDCDKDNYYWDGAYQAYTEFIIEHGLEERVLHRKLGIIQKPRNAAT